MGQATPPGYLRMPARSLVMDGRGVRGVCFLLWGEPGGQQPGRVPVLGQLFRNGPKAARKLPGEDRQC